MGSKHKNLSPATQAMFYLIIFFMASWIVLKSVPRHFSDGHISDGHFSDGHILDRALKDRFSTSSEIGHILDGTLLRHSIKVDTF